MKHSISLPLAAGAGSLKDPSTQGDLTFRQSTRFKSKVLPYWDFVRIACLPTSDGNKTVIARDVPGKGTVIVQELQPTDMVQPSVTVAPSQTRPENLAKNKPSKRKKASQDKNNESAPKKQKLSFLGSDSFEGPINVVNGEGHIFGKESTSISTPLLKRDKNKPVGQSRRPNEEEENFISTRLKKLISSKNIKKSSTSSAKGRPSSLDNLGYSSGNDWLNSTMAGSDLRFEMVPASTGQCRIARGLVKDGISVFFINLTKGYLAFRTPLETTFIGLVGEGYLKLVQDKPSAQTKLRPDTEVVVDKDAVVAVGCKEGGSNLTVVMVTWDD